MGELEYINNDTTNPLL